ncbi:MAG: hypothetical protein SF029_17585 [bacterium]|nr:hypothetical protein [bacterium]
MRTAWLWLLALVIVLIVVGMIGVFWDYTQDDVFITFVYSRNIAEGNGFVFYPGERVQGTTTPLYTLMMAAVYALTPDLLHAGNVLGGLLLLAICALAVVLLRSSISRYGQAAAALLLASSPLVYISLGMETLLYGMLLLLGFVLWSRGQRTLAFLVAAALTWTRADGVVLGGTFGLLALWEAWQQIRATRQIMPAFGNLVRLALVYVAGTAPWFIFAWLYFGSPLPNTFGAKEELLEGLRFLNDGFRWRGTLYGQNPFHWLAFPLILIGAWRALVDKRLRAVAVWAFFYLLGYTLLNIAAFWYYTPLVIALILLAVLGAEWTAKQIIRRFNVRQSTQLPQPPVSAEASQVPLPEGEGFRVRASIAAYNANADLPRRLIIPACLFILTVSVVFGIRSAVRFGEPPPRMATYRIVGEWINVNTPPDSLLLVGDLGIVGYYAQRRTVDSPGLIVPEMYIKTPIYAALKYKPDYVVATQYLDWTRLAEQPWFAETYSPVAQISTPGDGEFSPMTIYRRRLPLQAPSRTYHGFDLGVGCSVEIAPGQAVPTETRLVLDVPNQPTLTRPFLWGAYPSVSAVYPEHLVEQGVYPHLPVGRYEWTLDCGETHTGLIEVLPLADAPGYTPIAEAAWGDFVQLRGIALPEGSTTWSGGSLEVVLEWNLSGEMPLEHSVTLQLLDANGAMMAQADHPPAAPIEQDGTLIDKRRLLLPPDLPEGTYTLRVGWYDYVTLEAVPINNADFLTLNVVIENRWPGGSGLP